MPPTLLRPPTSTSPTSPGPLGRRRGSPPPPLGPPTSWHFFCNLHQDRHHFESKKGKKKFKIRNCWICLTSRHAARRRRRRRRHRVQVRHLVQVLQEVQVPHHFVTQPAADGSNFVCKISHLPRLERFRPPSLPRFDQSFRPSRATPSRSHFYCHIIS